MRRVFIGRKHELERLLHVVQHTSHGIVRVSGPAGVGKTALLVRVKEWCVDHGVATEWIDAREREVTPELITAAVERLGAFAAGQRRVVFFEDLHHARGIERWLALSFPARRSQVTLIVTDRKPRSTVWFEGSAAEAQELALHPLPDNEIDEYLEARGVPSARRAEVTDLARGNPLLLSLGCESALSADPAAFDKLLVRLSGLLCDECDSPEKQHAAATLTIARGLPHELLAAVVADEAATTRLLRWLSSLSFVDESPLGLWPHEVARRACAARMRAHHPLFFETVMQSIRRYYDHQIQSATDPTRWVLDRLYLDRDLPIIKRHLPSASWDFPPLEPATAIDRDAIVGIVTKHQGVEASRRIAHWFERSREAFEVLRGSAGNVVGFVLTLELRPSTLDTIWPLDPALAIIAAHLRAAGWAAAARSAEPPPDARAIVFYAWSVDSCHQEPGADTTQLICHLVRRLATTPRLQFHFSITDRIERWQELSRFLGFKYEGVGELVADDKRFTVVAHDWRDAPLRTLLTRLPASAPSTTSKREPQSSEPEPLERPDLAELLQKRLAELATQAKLSEREREILDLLVLGRNLQEMGIALGITARTAKYHQRNILQKIGADSRLDILRLLL